MDVGVDEAGRGHLSLGVDDPIDLALESFADAEDLVALEHELPVADEDVTPALMAHDPRRLDFGAHAFSTQPSRQTLERIPRKWNQRNGELGLLPLHRERGGVRG